MVSKNTDPIPSILLEFYSWIRIQAYDREKSEPERGKDGHAVVEKDPGLLVAPPDLLNIQNKVGEYTEVMSVSIIFLLFVVIPYFFIVRFPCFCRILTF